MKTIAFNLLGIFPFQVMARSKILYKRLFLTQSPAKSCLTVIVPINYEATPQYLKVFDKPLKISFGCLDFLSGD